MLNTTLFFLPGAAGHFISRCIALLPDICCFVDPITKQIPQSVEEKFELFSYQSWHNDSKKNWIEFENQVPVYTDVYPHTALTQTNSKVFHRFFHPTNSNISNLNLYSAPGPCLTMCVDTTKCFKWVVANSCYKNWVNGINIEMLENEKKLLLDPLVVNVDLLAIISSCDSFLDEFKRVAAELCSDFTNIDHSLIRLWHDWKTTTYSIDIV